MSLFKSKFTRGILLTGVIALGAAGGSVLLDQVQFARAEQKVEATRQQLSTVQDLASVFREVGKVVEPSVVNIQVQKSVAGNQRKLPFDDEFLKKFFPDRDGDGEPDVPEGFGQGDQGPQEAIGQGSGVIMEFDGTYGYVLTNNHVAGGATEMVVTLSDGREIKDAKVVGTDPKTDLAVVKIQSNNLIPAKWGDSDELQKGDFVLAFGSPFGYVGSMTHGIVSALNRQAGILDRREGYENFIQTDCPINPGNSGGPLVNLRGEVIGVNTAIASRSGGFQGIGFAIPSDQAREIYDKLKSKGRVTRGWLGVSISDVAKDLDKAQSFGFTGKTGVLVEQTFPDTPATGKLMPGDIVTKIDGKDVLNVQQLRNKVASTDPKTELTFDVFRGGKIVPVKLSVGEQPENLAMVGARGPGASGSTENATSTAAKLGVRLSTLTDEVAERFNLKDVKADIGEGAVVVGVDRNSVAAKVGLRPGDVITQVGETKVKTAKEAGDALGAADLKKGVRLYIASQQGSRFVFVKSE